MNIKDFKSGTWKQQYLYKSFSPARINIEWQLDDARLSYLISEADRHLGELNVYSQFIPDVDFFIKMHIAKEATTSSRIEGTQTNFEEAFAGADFIKPEKKNDWQEVQNYINALNFATGKLEELPVSSRLIKETHEILLHDVRGKRKLPGQFRQSQNWIGPNLDDAVFVPPHHSEISDLMADLENFLNNDTIFVPHLLRVALAHYQFETIHPFLDGNGRIGRLLITLYLVSQKILIKPSLYLSDYFERNRSYYYEYLNRVRLHSDLTQYLKFFMTGVIETSLNSIATFKSIVSLREKIEKEKLMHLGRRLESGKKLLNMLYQNPITNSQKVTEELGVNISTATRLLNDFVELGILQERTGFRRNRIFAFEEYIKLYTN